MVAPNETKNHNKELFRKDDDTSIHHKTLQKLAIKIY